MSGLILPAELSRGHAAEARFRAGLDSPQPESSAQHAEVYTALEDVNAVKYPHLASISSREDFIGVDDLTAFHHQAYESEEKAWDTTFHSAVLIFDPFNHEVGAIDPASIGLIIRPRKEVDLMPILTPKISNFTDEFDEMAVQVGSLIDFVRDNRGRDLGLHVSMYRPKVAAFLERLVAFLEAKIAAAYEPLDESVLKGEEASQFILKNGILDRFQRGTRSVALTSTVIPNQVLLTEFGDITVNDHQLATTELGRLRILRQREGERYYAELMSKASGLAARAKTAAVKDTGETLIQGEDSLRKRDLAALTYNLLGADYPRTMSAYSNLGDEMATGWAVVADSGIRLYQEKHYLAGERKFMFTLRVMHPNDLKGFGV